MSRFSDSRDPQGPGFFILQDHGYTDSAIPESGRASLVGVRVKGRRDQETEYGDWIEDEFARGPIAGGFFWGKPKKNAGEWRFAWPAVTATFKPATDDRDPNTASGDSGAGEFSGSIPPVGDAVESGGLDSAYTTAWYDFDWEKALADANAGNYVDEDGNPDYSMTVWVKQVAAQQIKIQQQQKGVKQGGGGGGNIWGGNFGNAFPGAGGAQNFVGALMGGGPWQVQFGQLQPGNSKNIFGLGLGNSTPTWVFPPYDSARALNRWIEKQRAKEKNSNAQDKATGAWYSELSSEVTIPLEFYPRNSNWLPDRRHNHLKSSWPIGWPQIPRGFDGVVLASSANDEQANQFHPTDPRLVAANYSGPGSMGTPVADMGGPDHSLDLSRHSPLQSILRVIPGPTGKDGMLGKNKKAEVPRAWIARNIGPSGQWDVCGGLVCDLPTGRRGTIARESRILAMESCIYGGPFDVGHFGDAHEIGSDADGRPINSLHITTEALFKVRGDWFKDGPLYFEDAPYEEADDLTFPLPVHLRWDGPSGYWKWQTTCEIVVPVPTITPNPQPDPDPDPEPTPITPSNPPGGAPPGEPDGGRGGDGGRDGGGGGDEGGGDGRPPWGGDNSGEQPERDPWDNKPREIGDGSSADKRQDYSGIMVRELTTPSQSYRPQLISDGKQDTRFSWKIDNDTKETVLVDSPITARIEGWGAQGGETGGPYLGGGSEWAYTQEPENSRYIGGTGNGGLLVLPPEVDMSHIDDSFVPAGLDVSETYLAAGPGASIGWGTPELATGGLKSGWSSSLDGEELAWYTHDSDGVKTKVISFDTDGSMTWLRNVVAKSGNANVADDEDVLLTTGSITITLPDAALNDGRTVEVKKVDTGSTLTIDTGGETIDGDPNVTVADQYNSLTFISDGTNWFIL